MIIFLNNSFSNMSICTIFIFDFRSSFCNEYPHYHSSENSDQFIQRKASSWEEISVYAGVF
jgi:hypothetical protein